MKRPPALGDLPPPPPGRTGWPWTESHPAPESDTPWPRIVVVTPSLNQAPFLEETIRSVLLQGYPALEYHVLDGGSDDGSLEILRRYEPFLTGWRSRPDGGQAAAIAEGFRASGGALLAWLNSDDVYLPGALLHVGERSRDQPGACLLGAVQDGPTPDHVVRARGIELPAFVRFWEERYAWHQPGLFIPRGVYDDVGGLDTSLSLVFDHDLMCRLLQRAPFTILDRPLARFRRHAASKSQRRPRAFAAELARVVPRYRQALPPERQAGFERGLARALIREAAAGLVRGRLDEAATLIGALLRLPAPVAAWRAAEGRSSGAGISPGP